MKKYITHEQAKQIISQLPKVDNVAMRTYIKRQEKKDKPTKPQKDGSYDICPNCKKCLPVKWANVYRKYCGNCGQAIDWSDDETPTN